MGSDGAPDASLALDARSEVSSPIEFPAPGGPEQPAGGSADRDQRRRETDRQTFLLIATGVAAVEVAWIATAAGVVYWFWTLGG